MFIKQNEIREHQGSVFTLADDSHFLYSAGADKFVTRWNIEEQLQDSFSIKSDYSIYKIAVISSLNLLVLGSSNGNIFVINTDTKKEEKFLDYHKSAIFEIQYDSNNNRLYVGDANGVLSVWDALSWKLLVTLPFDCGKIRSILIDDFDGKVYLGSQDGFVRVLDFNNFNLIKTFEAHTGGCLTISLHKEKSSVLFTSGKDGIIKCWDRLSCKLLLAIPAHNYGVYKLVSFDTFLISASRDKSIKVWNVNNMEILQKLTRKEGGHSHSVNDLVIYNDKLISCGDDKRIITWEYLY
jgi:WD40 repeat protein